MREGKWQKVEQQQQRLCSLHIKPEDFERTYGEHGHANVEGINAVMWTKMMNQDGLMLHPEEKNKTSIKRKAVALR